MIDVDFTNCLVRIQLGSFNCSVCIHLGSFNCSVCIQLGSFNCSVCIQLVSFNSFFMSCPLLTKYIYFYKRIWQICSSSLYNPAHYWFSVLYLEAFLVAEFNKNLLGLTAMPTSQRHSEMEVESVSAVLLDLKHLVQLLTWEGTNADSWFLSLATGHLPWTSSYICIWGSVNCCN
jgi:hypothetical protein